MNNNAIKKFITNLLKFTAPMLATFFLLLSQGVSVEKAWPVALIALYGALADFFAKLPAIREGEQSRGQ